jgi:hypothetical protein
MLGGVYDVRPLAWLLTPPARGVVVLRAGVELPRADLEAMRRDGFVVHVAGGTYLPCDAAPLRSARCAALRAVVPAGRVVALLAAAWAHGADADPDPVEVLVEHAVTRPRPEVGVRERESRVPACDVVEVDGVRLTTRARTAADVARWLPAGTAAPVVAALMAAGTSATDVLEVLGRRRYRNAVRARALVVEVSSGGAR